MSSRPSLAVSCARGGRTSSDRASPISIDLANQTRSVVLALGFGAFLISTLYLVQATLIHEFGTSTQASGANLLFFDVQEDQVAGVDSAIRASGYVIAEQTPIVTMRIASINGVAANAGLSAADTTDSAGGEPLRNHRVAQAARARMPRVIEGAEGGGRSIAILLRSADRGPATARSLGPSTGVSLNLPRYPRAFGAGGRRTLDRTVHGRGLDSWRIVRGRCGPGARRRTR